ncbi:hypothetical protein B0H17DRAFT_1129161 [Mycena rosella]|uniref:Uncharacterized protein n=1 Tax=Mycena rosella TaxID=1033263 RepID=A0AAD7DTQ2_MYCRO|nr:hypothetical protein B0H17DRAFT_1129161 [Mycena rosella]
MLRQYCGGLHLGFNVRHDRRVYRTRGCVRPECLLSPASHAPNLTFLYAFGSGAGWGTAVEGGEADAVGGPKSPGFPKWEDFGAGPNSAKYLTPSLSDDPEPAALLPFNADDGAYVAFSTQWERAFQSKSKLDPIELKLHLVRRGMNELVLAHTWAAHYVGLASARELDMI